VLEEAAGLGGREHAAVTTCPLTTTHLKPSAHWLAFSKVATSPPSPLISVVIPWRIFDSTRLSISRFVSDWPSRSKNPGATISLAASIRRAAPASERSPMAAIRSPRTPTAARNQGAPVPSTTRPRERIRS
jgi:hypothetical protein